MPLEQMRDAPEVAEASSFEQNVLNKRTGRKRKAPQDDEVRHDRRTIKVKDVSFEKAKKTFGKMHFFTMQ